MDEIPEVSGFEKPAVVIDNGSHLIKAGFSCDNHPVAIFRTVVARPKHIQGRYGRAGHYDVFIGDEAEIATGYLSLATELRRMCERRLYPRLVERTDYNLNSPVMNGRIVQWDNMERVWHHVFYRELKVAPEDRAVIVACSPNLPMLEKIRATQVFFEALNIPALCIQPQSVLALYGSGQTTGITVDLGYDSVNITPVYEGGNIIYAQMSTGYAGAQVKQFFMNNLDNRKIEIGDGGGEIIDEMMSKTMYVTKEVSMPRRGFEKPYKLPSGKTVDLYDEAFMASEMFFQPELIRPGSNILSLQDAIQTVCLKCDSELRSELLAAVVTSGGLSMIPGLNERLQQELEIVLGTGVKVLTSTESNVVSWMGASTFAGIEEARRMWITKKQYEDHGARIIRNRFM